MGGEIFVNPVALSDLKQKKTLVRTHVIKARACSVTRQKLPHRRLNSLSSHWQTLSFPSPEKDYQTLGLRFFFFSWHIMELSATNEPSTRAVEFCSLAFTFHLTYLKNIRTRKRQGEDCGFRAAWEKSNRP